jgi:lipopolysaccharide export system permease protein
MDLQNGEIHELDLVKMTEYKRIRFQKHRIVTEVQGFDFERTNEGTVVRGDRELSAQTMRGIVDSLQRERSVIDSGLQQLATMDMERLLTGRTPDLTRNAVSGESQNVIRPFQQMLYNQMGGNQTTESRARYINATIQNEILRIQLVEKQIDVYKVEIYKKYSIPIACLVFVLLGIPLGIMSKRGGFGIAATLSLGFFLLYWACLIGGEKLADRDLLSPFWGMWMANIALGALGIYLTIRIGKEAVVLNFDFLKRLIPQRWRRTSLDDDALQTAEA